MVVLGPAEKSATLSPARISNLDGMGLPRDYPALNALNQKRARFVSLRSWFHPDPARAHILVTDVEKFIKAHRLWVTFYLKPDPWNASVYHFNDPDHKYDMVRAAMAPPVAGNKVAKCVIVAPRGSTKTITIIQEMCTMIAVCRTTPVEILMSQLTDDRTKEEMHKIKMQIEKNETIHRDFGGPGVLWPVKRIGGEKWKEAELDFMHNRSVIMGYSIASAQRGRRPTLGIIDDPEEDETSKNQEWRKKHLRWLFHTYVPMFKPGGRIVWIGTIIHDFACLQMALRGIKDAGKGEEDETARDKRFDTWNKKRFSLIENYGTENERSIFPDLYTVEEFHQLIIDIGLAGAMAEMQGTPVAEGAFVFELHENHHFWMRCYGDDGDYFLDCLTGETMPWKEFLKTLYIVGAVDPADSVQAHADPGAIAILGCNSRGVIYVLDMWVRRGHADQLVLQAYDMCMALKAERIGWEKEGFQTFLFRYARRHEDELRRQGLAPPISKALENQRKSKERRIIAALRPVIVDKEIRFRRFREFVDFSDKRHVASPDPHQKYHRILQEQVDGYTDEGGMGHDDAVDSVHMGIVLLGRHRGKKVENRVDDPKGEEWQRWEDAGVPVERKDIPHDWWSKKQWAEWEKERLASIHSEMDPYDDDQLM